MNIRFYEDSMLNEYIAEHPGATEKEILAFLAGARSVLKRIQNILVDNQMIIIQHDADNETIAAADVKSNILIFPTKDEDE